MSDDDRGSPSDQGEGRVVSISGTSAGTSGLEAVAILSGHYAAAWWEDACGEVPAEDDDRETTRHAMRRQIVFAVCALESWFFEWVRDDVLGAATPAAELFTRAPNPVPDRIKCVLGELHARGELAAKPGYGESTAWGDLYELLRCRNGLVHALASRPRGDLPPDVDEGRPTPEDLRDLAPSRPVEIVRKVAVLLTSFADSEPPDWMTVPGDEG